MVNRIKKLVDLLNTYRYEYYTLGKPSVSDNTYDKLFDELKKLEDEQGLILSNSPTITVGYAILDKLKKATHKYPMLSLDKVKIKEIDKLQKWIGNKKVVCMAKEDGLTVQLTYDHQGYLIKAETRGNGQIGEDITHNIVCFSNIPTKINVNKETIITGEAIIDYKTFDEINNKLDKDKQYKNPRNLVSGTVRQLDNKICKERKPKFIAYIYENSEFKSKVDQLAYLRGLGFDITPFREIEGRISINELNNIIDELKDAIEQLSHPIDGLVFTYDDIEYGKSLGSTSHHPLHSIALKFQEDSEITTLREVKWQVNRTGLVKPVAIFDTVELAGTEVSRATLENLDYIEDLKIGIGDEIVVIKANEIIPKIIDNITKSNTLDIPTHCPICSEKLIVDGKDSRSLYCVNENCNSKIVKKIQHFCSKEAMNIEGLSIKTIEALNDIGLLNSINDLYKLVNPIYKNKILKLEKFGVKKYNNLIDSINKSRECYLHNFIYALGIPNVGKTTAKDMVDFCSENGDLDAIETLKVILCCGFGFFKAIPDIGDVVANSICDYFNNIDDDFHKLVSELSFKEYKTENKNRIVDNKLKGKIVYPTGKFAINKNELKLKLEGLGAIISSGYKKSLDYLIVGGDASKSGKVDKAIKDGVELMSEEELMELLGE